MDLKAIHQEQLHGPQKDDVVWTAYYWTPETGFVWEYTSVGTSDQGREQSLSEKISEQIRRACARRGESRTWDQIPESERDAIEDAASRINRRPP